MQYSRARCGGRVKAKQAWCPNRGGKTEGQRLSTVRCNPYHFQSDNDACNMARSLTNNCAIEKSHFPCRLATRLAKLSNEANSQLTQLREPRSVSSPLPAESTVRRGARVPPSAVSADLQRVR